ncbi:hemopexin repeat-containing protein [Sphingomonas sp. BK580]|uniref:hemopexin repeat-containing protein n=1 Tax=Sphingomonas sp. BK580 TaxID=2586972 RepID=UPI001619C1BF|nr:hemopexin repeat-containing protein [Sphingomonas sp. BK580]MBB3693169.1 hypothetical protein [Sphingomonas sp. BK580]
MGTGVYFFSSGTYLRYDRADDRTSDGYPKPIAGNWPGLAEAGMSDRVDAAVNWENGKLYLFRGGSYVRYDVATDRVDDGFPLPIAQGWPTLAGVGFADGLDAAVNWGNGKAFFFKGGSYVRYDVASDRVDAGYPLSIAATWNGFAAAGFGASLDGAINWGNGRAYFFKGDRYLAFDIAADRVMDGYPLPIAQQWPGLSPGVRAPVDTMDLVDELWLESAEVRRAPVTGPRFAPVPWRGVLHTTEGDGIDGAINEFVGTNFWPHLTIEPNTHRVLQHISLSVGSRALSDKFMPDNAARAIQIEIVGRAQNTPDWSQEQLSFVRDVMRSVEALVPIPRVSDRRFLDANGVNANPTNRMSLDEWKRFSGWCGHQHAPLEDHWDPGGIDIDTLLAS